MISTQQKAMFPYLLRDMHNQWNGFGPQTFGFQMTDHQENVQCDCQPRGGFG